MAPPSSVRINLNHPFHEAFCFAMQNQHEAFWKKAIFDAVFKSTSKNEVCRAMPQMCTHVIIFSKSTKKFPCQFLSIFLLPTKAAFLCGDFLFCWYGKKRRIENGLFLCLVRPKNPFRRLRSWISEVGREWEREKIWDALPGESIMIIIRTNDDELKRNERKNWLILCMMSRLSRTMNKLNIIFQSFNYLFPYFPSHTLKLHQGQRDSEICTLKLCAKL